MAHGKVNGYSNNMYLIDSDGDRQIWSVDEYEAAREVQSALDDAVLALREVKCNLPDTFDTSYIESVISDAEDMQDWYSGALSNAEEV